MVSFNRKTYRLSRVSSTPGRAWVQISARSLKFLAVLFKPAKKIPGQYLKLGHHCSLPRYFQCNQFTSYPTIRRHTPAV
jgi:hypothetical protein